MRWSDAVDLEDVAGWSELPENGLGAVLGAVAGPGRLGRAAGTLGEHGTRVTVTDASGERTWHETRTASDQRTVDEAVDDYLRDAGLPPRPRGYRWFIASPLGLAPDADVIDLLSRQINRSDAVSPAEVLAEAQRLAAVVYSRTDPAGPPAGG
jgi:hypothetical protein